MNKSNHLPIRKVYIIYKKSVYQKYVIDEKNKHLQKLVKSRHESAKKLLDTHQKHLSAIETIKSELKKWGIKYNITARSDMTSLRGHDLVITVGGDGTFLRTASHLKTNQLILGINSVPEVSTGALCAIKINEFSQIVPQLMNGDYKIFKMPRIAIHINGKKLPIEAINDVLFTNGSPAATSRYIISFKRKCEEHKSSGIWISTASGSTAAIHAAGGTIQKKNDDRLQLLVREPYQGIYNPYKITRLFLKKNEKVSLISKMIKSSIYLDGPTTHCQILYGDHITFSRSTRNVHTIKF